jgi:hypothetical protein
MKVRIYTNNSTKVNENWNHYGELETNPDINSFKDPLITGKPLDWIWGTDDRTSSLQQDFYQKIGIDIVTESVFAHPYPAVTEKILRPIVNKRMFLIVGPANTLKFLKTKGFKTFSPFIDETYDSITDPIDRMKAILSEIDRLVTLPIDEVRNAVLQYKDVLDSNFTTVMNLEKLELQKVKERLSAI